MSIKRYDIALDKLSILPRPLNDILLEYLASVNIEIFKDAFAIISKFGNKNSFEIINEILKIVEKKHLLIGIESYYTHGPDVIVDRLDRKFFQWKLMDTQFVSKLIRKCHITISFEFPKHQCVHREQIIKGKYDKMIKCELIYFTIGNIITVIDELWRKVLKFRKENKIVGSAGYYPLDLTNMNYRIMDRILYINISSSEL